jgi:hypothetical protein
MAKKYNVQVRNGDGTVIETIKVTIRCEAIGNFAPLFCTYKNDKRCLIESDELHLDDPLRCNESDHINNMFIRPRGKDGYVVATWDLVGAK